MNLDGSRSFFYEDRVRLLRPAATLALAWTLGWAGVAAAVPGPDSTLVVANGRDPESAALAELYRSARSIPTRQVCPLDLPVGQIDLELAEYRSSVEAVIDACLDRGGIRDRIEAVALIRGVPLRVAIPAPGGAQRASLAAVLGIWKTVTATGAPLLGQAPGAPGNCGGTSCIAARIRNPFTRGVFAPNWSRSSGGFEHRPLLVTMIHGRSNRDAARLVASATTAEASGGARGRFVFMRGADPARGALDLSYDLVAQGLTERGFTDVEQLPFDGQLGGREIAAFFTGTAQIGSAIEGNRYLPGSLVDNLTSFGALPPNFGAPAEEVQVSIARWVAMGVAGVHGTTDEPLNNCFPDRGLILSYVDGHTLAESYARAMPFVYWRNLVLGDPMAAPYAERPRVEIGGVRPGEVVAGSARVSAQATDDRGRTIGSLVLYASGVEVARAAGAQIEERCLALPEGATQLLAVAQIADDGAPGSAAQPKGWSAVELAVAAGPGDCSAPDAGLVDAGAPPAPDAAALLDAGGAIEDAGGSAPPPEGGCGCRAADGQRRHAIGWWVLLGIALLCSRRDRSLRGLLALLVLSLPACATPPPAEPAGLPKPALPPAAAPAPEPSAPMPDPLGSADLIDIEPKEVPAIVRRPGAKAVLVNVWATWCEPCVREMPWILRVGREFRAQGVETVLISADFREQRPAAQRFLIDQGVDFPSYFKSGDDQAFIEALAKEWSGALPVTMIFGPQGSLQMMREGEIDEAALRAALEVVLQ